MTKYTCDCGKTQKYANQLNEVMKELICPFCHTKLKPEIIQTKLDSYISLDEEDLSERRKKIYQTLINNPLTDQELAKKLGYQDPNKVRPRRKELCDMGLVKEHNRRPCTISGKKVIEWVAI